MRTLGILLFLFATPLFAASPFFRAGVGFDRTRDTTVRDLDCSATNPPALFGCGIEARGDFGSSLTWNLGAGYDFDDTRVELALTHRPGFALDAQANFLGVSEDQPVRADVQSTAAMVQAARRFGWFFVEAGAGIARNTIDETRYEFPSIAADAVTITAGGTHNTFAWTAGAGVSWPVTDRATVDLGVRYTNLGTIASDADSATIIRPNRTLTLDIAGTRAELRTIGITASLRWRM